MYEHQLIGKDWSRACPFTCSTGSTDRFEDFFTEDPRLAMTRVGQVIVGTDSCSRSDPTGCDPPGCEILAGTSSVTAGREVGGLG